MSKQAYVSFCQFSPFVVSFSPFLVGKPLSMTRATPLMTSGIGFGAVVLDEESSQLNLKKKAYKSFREGKGWGFGESSE